MKNLGPDARGCGDEKAEVAVGDTLRKVTTLLRVQAYCQESTIQVRRVLLNYHLESIVLWDLTICEQDAFKKQFSIILKFEKMHI